MPSAPVPQIAGGRSDHHRRAWQDALVRRYQVDPASRERVTEQLLPLVRTLARQYKRGEEPLDDLVQAGAVGLVKALQRCDLSRGNFIAYAVPTITGEIRRHYRDTGWGVHVPRGVQELAQRVTRAERSFLALHGRSPSPGELAEQLDVSIEAIVDARVAANGLRTTNLDLWRDDDASQEAASALLAVTETGYSDADDRATIEVLARELDERDRVILTLRYARDLTQSEIGDRMGVSQMQVSRRLRIATERMRRTAGHVSG